MYAKQSTAKTFLLGPILDSAGAAKTDEVVASIKVTKNGTVGAVDAQDTLTHNHTGHYVFVSDGDDFGTLGEVEFSLNSGTNAMAPVKFQVVTANVYDTWCGADNLDVNVAQWLGTAAHAATTAGIPVVHLHDPGVGSGGLNAPTNFDDLSIVDTTGLVAMAATQHVIVDSGTVTTLTNPVTLADGAHGGIDTTITLQTPIQATVPDTQKVDLNTIKMRAVADVGVGNTAYVGTSAWNTTTPPTAAAIADAVLDEVVSVHNTEDTLGNILNDLTEKV